ncbi:MAG TPA: YbaB/EbfC family nucleoid-associated protein [Spirochaetota bacterium]|nr:YbaB/EbfC family nucleoid-associated protein [Spirochaetota bacterium]HOM38107.1 YbaB/EbfC family nucleoid-associated protein [Spirochaetota bacterium]HPQ48909.1 YbaB/EbfC family nucleoid-associated protein [Spirochaetota bacterium]
MDDIFEKLFSSLSKSGFNLESLMNNPLIANISNNIKGSFANIEVNGSSGGGMVEVTVKPGPKVEKINISDEVFKENDKEMLQELIIAALNDAFSRLEEVIMKETQKQAMNLFNNMRFK